MAGKIEALVTHQDALESFDYYPETGELFWKVGVGNSAKGKLCGTIKVMTGDKPYRCMTWRGASCRYHRVVWFYYYGAWPKYEIDHIDGDSLNNRINNLRDVDASTNQRNRVLNKNNRSGISGISWSKAMRKWQVSIKVGSVRKHLGYFNTLQEATNVRLQWQNLLGYHENHGKVRTYHNHSLQHNNFVNPVLDK